MEMMVLNEEAAIRRGRDAFPTLVQRGWPEWAIALLYVLLKLEASMSNIGQAEQDLASAVEAVAAEVANLQQQVANAGSANQAELQAAADSVEQQVATLRGLVPAAPSGGTDTGGTTDTGGPTTTGA